MIKRSFFGIKQPVLEYTILGGAAHDVKTIPLPETVQLFSDNVHVSLDSVKVKPGDAVKTGQILPITDTDSIVSTVTGTVKGVTTYVGDFGREFSSVTIDVADSEEKDSGLGEALDNDQKDVAAQYMTYLPGKPGGGLFLAPEAVKCVVITGMDDDLLVTTRQFVLGEKSSSVKKGIKTIKEITGVENVYMTVPERLGQDAIAAGAAALVADPVYPSATPCFIVETIGGETIQEKDCGFISVEAVASIGEAYDTKNVPVNKMFTLIDKYNRKKMVSARIGTPLKDVFKELYITVNDNDRIVVGGPMKGAAVYSEDYPICPDTDAVIVQDRSDVPFVTDNYCINCGECVRVCPARVPVNVLVRFLEAGEYEVAADNYDLHSCVDCGLCSYVCTAGIPVFHYIRLAKYELSRTEAAEETNA